MQGQHQHFTLIQIMYGKQIKRVLTIDQQSSVRHVQGPR
jgi:hypothetical protein